MPSMGPIGSWDKGGKYVSVPWYRLILAVIKTYFPSLEATELNCSYKKQIAFQILVQRRNAMQPTIVIAPDRALCKRHVAVTVQLCS